MGKLQANQIVKLRNGKYGVTAEFNGNVFQLIFAAYSSPISAYNEELKHKNTNYDIVAVYDASKVENVLSVFKKSFDADKLELPIVWKES